MLLSISYVIVTYNNNEPIIIIIIIVAIDGEERIRTCLTLRNIRAQISQTLQLIQFPTLPKQPIPTNQISFIQQD